MFLQRLWWRLISFGFRLLYHELAFTYDAVSWLVSLGQWRCWQQSALPHLPQPQAGPLLEIAHGPGHLQNVLHRQGYQVLGGDFSAQMGFITLRRLTASGFIPRLMRLDAGKLPFENGVFAGVVTTFPTSFIITPQIWNEVHRVLMDEGVFVIIPSARITGGGIWGRFLEWLYQITGQRDGGDFDWRKLGKKSGFSMQAYSAECPYSRVEIIVAKKQSSEIRLDF